MSRWSIKRNHQVDCVSKETRFFSPFASVALIKHFLVARLVFTIRRLNCIRERVSMKERCFIMNGTQLKATIVQIFKNQGHSYRRIGVPCNFTAVTVELLLVNREFTVSSFSSFFFFFLPTTILVSCDMFFVKEALCLLHILPFLSNKVKFFSSEKALYTKEKRKRNCRSRSNWYRSNLEVALLIGSHVSCTQVVHAIAVRVQYRSRRLHASPRAIVRGSRSSSESIKYQRPPCRSSTRAAFLSCHVVSSMWILWRNFPKTWPPIPSMNFDLPVQLKKSTRVPLTGVQPLDYHCLIWVRCVPWVCCCIKGV